MTERTWAVLLDVAGAVRTEETDHLARSVTGGLSYLTGEALPAYLGVWLAPNGGTYHLYSDYPESHHERFGWVRVTLAT